MATATACKHCHTAPISKTITTRVPGTKTVTLALCNCDYLDCKKCGGKIRDPYAKGEVCTHCR